MLTVFWNLNFFTSPQKVFWRYFQFKGKVKCHKQELRLKKSCKSSHYQKTLSQSRQNINITSFSTQKSAQINTVNELWLFRHNKHRRYRCRGTFMTTTRHVSLFLVFFFMLNRICIRILWTISPEMVMYYVEF